MELVVSKAITMIVVVMENVLLLEDPSSKSSK
jgi:hypothetical protein